MEVIKSALSFIVVLTPQYLIPNTEVTISRSLFNNFLEMA